MKILARAIIIAAIPNSLNRYKKGLHFDKKETDLKPLVLDIVRTAASFLRIKKCQSAITGMRVSNHKNPVL